MVKQTIYSLALYYYDYDYYSLIQDVSSALSLIKQKISATYKLLKECEIKKPRDVHSV